MARTAKKAAASKAAPVKSTIERPAEPKRFKASKEQLLGFYKQMLLIRRFEERAGRCCSRCAPPRRDRRPVRRRTCRATR